MVDGDGNELGKPTKRKVAIVVGYVGSAFHGWQECTNRDVRTVEGVLEKALWKAGAIADSNYGDLNKIGWGRTSRTDKGVHASKTVASAKLLLPQETFNEAGLSQYGKEALNAQLPDDVRCFSVSKVPKSFRGRDECTLREYSYYLPKSLLPDDKAIGEFRRLLNLFVGSHSFHNFATMKGRQLKEVRKRVQASIDLKRSGGSGVDGGGKAEPAEGEGTGDAATAAAAAAAAAPADGVASSEATVDDKSARASKRERTKDWRTYRYKKKSAVEQEEEDKWFGKSPPSWSKSSSIEEGAEGAAGGATGDGVASPGGGIGLASGEPKRAGENANGDAAQNEADAEAGAEADEGAGLRPTGLPSGGRVEAPEGDPTGQDGEDDVEDDEKEDEGAPQKVLMLRELRTSIYRCELLDGVARHVREGEKEPDEFLRVDIRGKAFVYNQIRLMIGGALAEARGELMPGFVEAALKTPYRLRVPLAPADGLVLESQAFTRHANALVLDPRDLSSIGGTLARWGHVEGGNEMQTSGRLQTLLTAEQFREAEEWRDEHILPAVAEAWAQRGSAQTFLEAIQKFFVGRQRSEQLLSAIREHLDRLEETERAAEEKHNRHRAQAKEQGSSKYKDLLPKNIATQIVCKFRLLPGNKVSAIQRGVAKCIEEGDLPLLSDCRQVLEFIERKGVEEMAKMGGFVPPDLP